MASNSYRFAIIALFAVFATANGLKCHKCNTKEEAKCAYPITSFLYDTEECSSPISFVSEAKCYKLVAQDKDGNEFIQRGCLPTGGIACSAIIGTIGQISDAIDQTKANCYVCGDDKCNGAPKLTAMSIFGLVLAAVAFLF